MVTILSISHGKSLLCTNQMLNVNINHDDDDDLSLTEKSEVPYYIQSSLVSGCTRHIFPS